MRPMAFSARLAPASRQLTLTGHLVAGLLSIGSVAGVHAHPLDSPDIVYVDGVPCNGACQSYMAWSRKTLEEKSTPAAPSRHSEPARKINRTGVASVSAPKAPTPMPPTRTREVVPVPREIPHAQTAELARTAVAMPVDEAPRTTATLPPVPSEQTIRQQILAATSVAEHITAAPPLPANEEVAENSEQADSAAPSNESAIEKQAAAIPPTRAPELVVLVLAKAEIASIGDLASKDIAIENSQAQFREQIRTGIVAAGAPMVELRDGAGSAVDRLVSGEQPAAILTLASPEAADGFPEIEGFRTFRIPLSPG